MLSRRSFMQGMLGLAGAALVACGAAPQDTASNAPTEEQATLPDVSDAEQQSVDASESDEVTEEGLGSEPEEADPMQIQVVVNGAAFTATLDAGTAGQELRARLPLTLTMDELHGNEKYCYTGEAFGGSSYVPSTIEAGDLMVFGSDCLVLFYETFANDGWAYQRVGRIDDASGLADACGLGEAVVEFSV